MPVSLYVGGQSADSLNFVKEGFSFHFGRRGPSVHMNYVLPEDINAEWLYNEVTVPEGYDQVGSYFMANGFAEGYFGIQVNSEKERKVLFSVWSPFETDNPNDIPPDKRVILVKKGKGVVVKGFGGEGSGGKSYLVYPWKAGNSYRFLNRVRPADNGRSEYTAYFYAPETGRWQLIAQFLRPETNTYYKSPYSFLENFMPTMGYISRKSYYNNQWAYTDKGEWIELTKALFTGDTSASKGMRMDYQGGVDEEGFYLKNGGFFNDNSTLNTYFERKHLGKKPNIKWDELE